MFTLSLVTVPSHVLQPLTVYALPIPLDLAVKDRVFVLGQHLLFRRHLLLPRFHLLQGLAQARKGGVEGRDDSVDAPETVTVAVLLAGG